MVIFGSTVIRHSVKHLCQNRRGRLLCAGGLFLYKNGGRGGRAFFWAKSRKGALQSYPSLHECPSHRARVLHGGQCSAG